MDHDYINSQHCKYCKSKYDRKWYSKNRERLLIVRRIYDKSEKGKKMHYISAYKHFDKYPEKYSARNRLGNAIKRGKIIKPNTCEINNSCLGRIEGHHHLGYEGEHWKDIQWLCHKHHRIMEGRWAL